MKHVYQNELLNIRNIQYISIYVCMYCMSKYMFNIFVHMQYHILSKFYLNIIKYITEYKITYIVIYE